LTDAIRLQILGFHGWEWRPLSSVIITHLGFKMVERFANWFMTADPPAPPATILAKYFASK
jgi:hypothetical protein